MRVTCWWLAVLKSSELLHVSISLLVEETPRRSTLESCIQRYATMLGKFPLVVLIALEQNFDLSYKVEGLDVKFSQFLNTFIPSELVRPSAVNIDIFRCL